MDGFTLIEIMVVLTIIGITLGLSMANFGTDERQKLQQEGRRLALLLSHASQTALSTGKSIGWKPTVHNYIFFQYQVVNNQWALMKQEQTLRPRDLPDNIRIGKITIAGQLAQKNEMIVFSPSGVNTEFDVTLHSEHAKINIHGDFLGKVAVELLEEAQQ